MTVLAPNLNTTLNIVDAVTTVLANKNKIGQGTQDNIRKATKFSARVAGTTSSLTALTATTTILSRVFIDGSIIDETIIPNLLKSIHEWYAAQIIAALQLGQMVDSGRSVQDVMAVVQTGYNNRQRNLLNNIVKKRFGTESFLENYVGLESDNRVEMDEPKSDLYYKDMKRKTDNNSTRVEFEKSKKELNDLHRRPGNEMSVRSVASSEHRIGPMGELFEIKIKNPAYPSESTTIPVFVQMQPSVIDADIAPRFIDLNVAPTFFQRYTMMRAGELTFWKDFVGHRDMILRQKSIMKDPRKAEAFDDFLKTVAKKDKYALGDISDSLDAKRSSNLANSVIILSEEAVTQAKTDSGVDLHKQADRNRYFRDTYSMIVVVVDQLHQRVTVYFNGLEGSINVPYNDFRPKDTKFDPKDFMNALQAFSTNNVGRLR